MITLREVSIEAVLWWKVGVDRSTHMRTYVRREPVRIPESKVAQGLKWRFHATAVGIHNDLRRCQLITQTTFNVHLSCREEAVRSVPTDIEATLRIFDLCLAIESAESASCRDETVRGVLTAFEVRPGLHVLPHFSCQCFDLSTFDFY